MPNLIPNVKRYGLAPGTTDNTQQKNHQRPQNPAQTMTPNIKHYIPNPALSAITLNSQ